MHRVAIVLAIFATTACGGLRKRDHDGGGSVFKPGTWGHLSGARAHWLAQLRPGGSISVCGVAATEAARSLRMWASAVGRGDSLAIDSSCDRSADRVVVVADRSNPAVDKACKERPDAAGLALIDHGVILLCVADQHAPILLHETGHLWGLCDVYPLASGMADNCDPQFFTGRSRDSVMGASYGRELTLGDRQGLSRLTMRDDVAGNAAWPVAVTPGASRPMHMVESSTPLESRAYGKSLASDVVSGEDVSEELLDAVRSQN
jgi:hypothetical protein